MNIVIDRGTYEDARFRRDFAAAPRIVRRDPYDRFLPAPSTWEHHLKMGEANGAFWLARSSGEIVGRIGATLSPTRAGTGYVGYFEAADGGDPAIARALLDTAFAWLRERGVAKAYGPIDRSTWYTYRYWVDPLAGDAFPAHEEPFAWEPWQPKGYVDAFTSAGFVEVERYFSHGYRGVPGMRLPDATALIRPAADAARAQGYRIERFSERWEEVLPDLHAVGNLCFAQNFLFEPLAWDEFLPLYESVGTKIDYRPSAWMIDPAGNKCAFMLAYVDRGYVVMKTIGVSPEHRRGGLSLALLWAACDRGLELGLDATLGALFKRGNNVEGLLRSGFAGATAWRHYYALFEKTL